MMKKYKLKYGLALAAGLFAMTAQAQVSDKARTTMREMRQSMNSEMGRKLGTDLMMLQRAAKRRGGVLAGSSIVKGMPGMKPESGYVSVTAYAIDDGQTLKADLESRGMLDAIAIGNSVSGRVPVTALEDMASSRQLRFMRPNMSITNAGLTTSQADRAMLVAPARQAFGVDGSGIRIGVLSDSFDVASNASTRAADDMRTKDLPPAVQVLRDCNTTMFFCTDEGRAMMQLIYDLAPGSPLSFHTAFGGEPMYAAGIRALAAAGAKVIVDDALTVTEPMFQDGVVAQSVDEVVRGGVSYFSFAGNEGRDSYAAAFRATEVNGDVLHDFDPGPGVDFTQRLTVRLAPKSVGVMSFQWDEPFVTLGGTGSRSEIDLAFITADGELVPFCDQVALGDALCQIPGFNSNLGGDAVEVPRLVNLTDQTLTTDTLSIAIGLVQGPAPRRMQYVTFRGSIRPAEFDTRSPALYGHANAAGAEAVAAAYYLDSIFGGSTNCLPACAEASTSVGGIPILFDKAGVRLAQPLFRANKPGITAVDGTNTTFFGAPDTDNDGFPNFFGTSAAAPHAAAVAALMYDRRARSIAAGTARRQLTPAAVVRILRETALDITQERLRPSGIGRLPTGPDTKTGAGLVQAISAIQAAQ